MKQAIHHLLDIRDKNTWMLFGTLPIYPCINDENDQLLLERLRNEKMLLFEMTQMAVVA